MNLFYGFFIFSDTSPPIAAPMEKVVIVVKKGSSVLNLLREFIHLFLKYIQKIIRKFI